MAVSDCIRQCRRCGVEFRRTAKGQPTKYCSSACRGKVWVPRSSGPKAQTCGQCGCTFIAKRLRKYCNKRCCWTAQARKKGVTRLAEHLERVRNPANWFTCECCGKDHHRVISGTNKTGNRYCSIDCRLVGLAHRRAVLVALREARREAACRVSLEVAALRRISSWKPGLRPTVRPCACCGAKAVGMGEHSRRCGQCAAAARREWARRARSTESGRARRRVEKSRRRAVERGATADLIDPIRVFERDGWRCHLCGCKTPRALRGTYEDAAPELDHVVPLAANGTHTWGNVACACRRCNLKKGAKPIGQLMMPFAA